jgi:hypothetical protein
MRIIIGALLAAMVIMFVATGANYQQADETNRLQLALNRMYVNDSIGIRDPFAERRYQEELAKVLYPERHWYQLWR